MSLDEFDLYGGLSGSLLPVDKYDLGCGVTFSRTFAHLMAPFMMAFSPAESGKPHPAPWRAAKGGFGFDITIQIHIPRDFRTDKWFDRLNSIWWFVALLRFRATPYIVVPVVASGAFAKAATAEEEIHFWPMEVEPRQLQVQKEASREIRVENLDWIKAHWLDAGKLMRTQNEFNLLFQACDQCIFTRHPSLALLSLWEAIEGLFSPAKVELKFRVSANIAAFLEPPGKGRLALQKRVGKLYDARSVAAHGGADVPLDSLADTYELTKRIITKIIEENRVPRKEDLEASLFGANGEPE
jgi:hypothetical protein